MSNALLLYQQTKSYGDIQDFVNQRTTEDIFLDFKETRSSDGKMLLDDKSLFSKAASGFAHQEGGVLIWGIEARKEDPKDPDSFDCACNLKPINKVKIFHSELTKYISISTEPPVDGIQHRIIFENDDEKSGKGFVVSFFPKSDEVHRAGGPGKTRDRFYKRHGDSFVPLGTAEIKALFFRSLSPDLELKVVREHNTLRFFLKNNGRGIAKNGTIKIGLRDTSQTEWYDGEGSKVFKVAQLLNIGKSIGMPSDFAKQFSLSPGVIVFPEDELCFALANCGRTDQTIEVKYRIFSENMIPKEGSINI